MRKPRLFVASSSEGLPVARALQEQLDNDAEVTLWTDGIFDLSRATFATLEARLRRFDYAAFVLSDDDRATVRGESVHLPRDNVLFELGLFAGQVGLDRTFVVHPASTKLPSDLLGLTTARYSLHSDGNLVASLGAVAAKIRRRLNEADPSIERMRWDDWEELSKKLASLVNRSPNLGGFIPDLLVGISRGGLIVAELISRQLGNRIPILSLWAERAAANDGVEFFPPAAWTNSGVATVLGDGRVSRILLIDDICRSGRSLLGARRFLGHVANGKTVRTAVLIKGRGSACDGVDYFAEERDTHELRAPFD